MGKEYMGKMHKNDRSKAESFFMNSFTTENIFRGVKRRDYIFLYHIRKCAEEDAENGRVYLSRLAESMDLQMSVISKAVKRLHEKGYVEWITDTEQGRTYVVLTSQVVELMAEEYERMKKGYNKILTEIGEEALEQATQTMIKVKDIIDQI